MSNGRVLPWRREPTRSERGSLLDLRREMDALFDGFFGKGPTGVEAFSPRVDVTEGEKGIRLVAVLPGVEHEDIEGSGGGGMVTLQGEKRAEKEDKGEQRYRLERTHGSFRRSFALPCEVDAEAARADFTKGVLTVVLPKTPAASSRKVEVKAS